MLLDLSPYYIEKKGKKEFVILPIEEYNKIEEALKNYEDLIDLRKAKQRELNKKTKSLDEVKKELAL